MVAAAAASLSSCVVRATDFLPLQLEERGSDTEKKKRPAAAATNVWVAAAAHPLAFSRLFR